MIRVLLTDDQHLVRTGLRALLENDPEIEVVGEAEDGQAALEAARSSDPDVVLMDIRMPGMDGVEATRRINEWHHPPQVLILTTFDDDDEVTRAIHAGAAGYLLKDTPGARLREAVHAVAAGDTQLSPRIMRKLMDRVADDAPRELPPDFSELTERELEVLTAIGQGRTNAEIAVEMYLSPATARTYVSRILAKLGARDRTELAIMAHRAGIA